MIAYYLTHPQVEIDRDLPIPQWGLSAVGRTRLEAMPDRAWLREVSHIVTSSERKAVETAAIVAARLELAYEIREDMGENDRSSTGFLEPDAFEAAADRFFAAPEESWNGWERACDAADRIVAVVETVLAEDERLAICFWSAMALSARC